jgi:hypothetical protein
MSNKKKKYTVALTAGGLLQHETNAIVEYLIDSKLSELNDAIKNSEVLKTNSQASRIRLVTELRRRNKAVCSDVWRWFKENNSNEQKITLFYICLKATPMLFDFQTEVVLEKWRSLDLHLDKNDVLYFFDKKAQFYEEIDQWSETTRIKAATVIIRILNETGILKDNKLTQIDASNSFWRFFVDQGDTWFLELCLLSKKQRDEIME